MLSVEVPAKQLNADIEVLRAYSVLAVLYEHTTSIVELPNIEQIRGYWNGWTGVDLFFVISGFVIYRSLDSTVAYGMSARDAVRETVMFWIRRFWRLAPAGWFWLAAGIVLMVIDDPLEVGSKHENISDLIASLLNFENFHRFACNAWQGPCGALYPHYWSLSLETQFYLILPALIVVLPRKYLVGVLVGVIAIQLPMRRPANGDVLGWFIRTDGLAWGILIARLSATAFYRLVEPTFLSGSIARCACTFGGLFAIGTAQYFWRESFFLGLVAIIAALLVLAASFGKGYIASPPGLRRALVWTGQRSYSLYVSHLIVFKGVRELCRALHIYDDSWPGKLAYLALAYSLTVAAAAMTHNWLEMPLRQRGREYARAYRARMIRSTLIAAKGHSTAQGRAHA
ncbi:acyltransferase [Bradyrhizobium sp. SZCCHNS2005]|uniref:acyltransferase family protein n=1 Tax=Bradyrhizobium sp. SZCCHNS2005 TaxID=3057303 RepID=UPI0028E3CD2B|nr:acyltransferase [Bradyrhizobium sp. SZCCHNS2005]